MPDNNFIYVHHLAVLEEILGPGRRLVIWMTGCPFHCQSCIEKRLQNLEYGDKYQITQFYEQILPFIAELKALTFTGGEPLFQKDACRTLLPLIKKEIDVDIMLYTGMSTEEFNNNYTEFHQHIDICVTEPFKLELHSNHLWRGSDNQKIISPSGRYKDKVAAWRELKSRGISLHFDKSLSYIYGIPPPNAMPELKRILRDRKIDISED